jgi:hypothetical protein
MYAHMAMRLAGMGLRGLALISPRLRITAMLAMLGCSLGACSVASSQGQGPHPADPQARVPATSYRAVTSGYESRRPVEPLPWRELNERVAPQEKPRGAQ